MAAHSEFDKSFYGYALRELSLGATLDFVTKAKSDYMEEKESELGLEDRKNEFSREINRGRLDAVIAANARHLELIAMIDDVYDGMDVSIRLEEND